MIEGRKRDERFERSLGKEVKKESRKVSEFIGENMGNLRREKFPKVISEPRGGSGLPLPFFL